MKFSAFLKHQSVELLFSTAHHREKYKIIS